MQVLVKLEVVWSDWKGTVGKVPPGPVPQPQRPQLPVPPPRAAGSARRAGKRYSGTGDPVSCGRKQYQKLDQSMKPTVSWFVINTNIFKHVNQAVNEKPNFSKSF